MERVAAEHTEFGLVRRLEADAVGPPGRRAFRLLATREDSTAWLWVEREQLQALAMLVEQLLTGWPAVQVSSAAAAQGEGRKGPAKFTAEPDVDFRVGQLAIGFDESSSLYVLLAHNVESESGEDPDFICRVTRPQLRSLSESIPTLLSGGRPRCPMCEQPLGRGKHKCQRANGHVSGIDGG